jgi:hypothetical protein
MAKRSAAIGGCHQSQSALDWKFAGLDENVANLKNSLFRLREEWRLEIMGLHRTHRRRMDRAEARATKAKNRTYKDKERDRRDVRMAAKAKLQKPPYTQAVMSWLSRQLDMPASRITPDHVKKLTA